MIRRLLLQGFLTPFVFSKFALGAAQEEVMGTTIELVEGPQCSLSASLHSGGKSVPVLFLHSDGGRLTHWDDIRSALTTTHPTAAFDRRGHGGSGAPRNGSFDKHDEANDVSAVAAAAGFRKFVLVGHSGGALVAFDYAAHHAESLSGLVLVDPPPDPSVFPPGTFDHVLEQLKGDNYRPFLENYYRSIAGGDTALANRIAGEALSTPQATMVGLMEALKGFEPKPLATGITMPALSIIQPQYDVEGALHRIPPGFPHETIADADHWIHLAARQAFLKVLLKFLARFPD